MRILLCALGLCFALVVRAADAPSIRFQHLAPGQLLTVSRVIYAWEVPGMTPTIENFEFQQIEGKLTVDVTTMEKTKNGPEKKTHLGKAEVTAKEAADLDKLMDLYRKRTPHHDLVVEHLDLTLKDKSGKELAKESYVDETGLRDRADLTRFSTLLSKASKP